ncbi:MAG TPA: M23 family peptidase, partial [Flavobacterium sp.]|nr:M23 family peptidase [Flavobacterium sp.]
MSKVKYYYDSENLAYRKIKTRKRIKFGVIILFLLAAALFGFLSFIILLNTPLQTREIEHLRLNYALLNKKMDQLNAVVDAIEDRDNNLYRVYFNKSAIPDSIRKEGFLGKNRYKILEGYDNSQLVINTTKGIDVLS